MAKSAMCCMASMATKLMSVRIELLLLVCCFLEGTLAADNDSVVGWFPLWLLIVLVIVGILSVLCCIRFIAKFFMSSEDKDKKRLKVLAQERINKSMVTHGGAWSLDDKPTVKQTSRDANPSSVYVHQTPGSRHPPPAYQQHQIPPKYQQTARNHKPVFEQPSLSSFYAEDSSMSIPQPGSFPANSKDSL